MSLHHAIKGNPEQTSSVETPQNILEEEKDADGLLDAAEEALVLNGLQDALANQPAAGGHQSRAAHLA